MRGHLFETMVVMELIKARLNQGREPNLYYYRDSQKNEIDLIYKQGAQLVPIEIKSTQTIQPSHFKNLHYFQKLVGNRFSPGYLLYAGDQTLQLQDFQILNYRQTNHIIK